VLAVSHMEFTTLPWDVIADEATVVYDIKGFLDKSRVTMRL
jgi:UDP-N-acetyl-D-galactosamine dehydrogenase